MFAVRLKRISFENYRGLGNNVIDFDEKSTVLFGVNGVGKSSIINAIGLIMSQVITKVVNNQFKQQITMDRNDVRFGSSAAEIEGIFTFSNGVELPYCVGYNKQKGTRYSNRKETASFTELFIDQYINDHAVLPVFACYGVNRVVLDIPLRIRTKHEFGRLETYQNAIGSQADFRTFFEWFRNQEDYENEMKIKLGDLNYKDHSLEATRMAIMAMLPEITNIRITRNPLRMCATKLGQTLYIEQLSDGEKCVIAMLGDLSRRLALANPNMDNPLLGSGIVLIDEVELHMHPSWQRKIIQVLHDVFPNIQFIITTHSPLALGGLNDDFLVYQLSHFERKINVRRMDVGHYDVNLVLEDKMGTPSISPRVTEIEEGIWNQLSQGNLEIAKDYVMQLETLTKGTHPSITKAHILLQRAYKRKGESQ